ncbi:MAG TPA: DegT/DnrJ/EryC1/StrS family aminotransferase [Candidatus Dojkabacteria bacterium]|nr:DegT/DnrJ/EryC1/StrS family aminotransferase [Methanofastidiosum sp.]HRZ84716.1 DegT/DnrJ/EryC1/StrS family aminotransferase [Candidatus Dojkabacteria bacterium]
MIPISKPLIEKEEIDAVVNVLQSGMIAQGPKVAELEEMFAKLCGTKYAVAVSNGTTALHTALVALGITTGDEVITVPFTFVATANPIVMQGGKVVFVDISEDDFCIDPSKIEEKITGKTKAIIPVDLFGQPYKYDEIKAIAEKHNLKILEDACQAIGARHNDLMVGNLGDVAAFSLYATKNIATGEGGMLTTNSEKIAKLAKMYRHHGQDEATRYEYMQLGHNYRLTDLAATIGVEQLKKIDRIVETRQRNAKLYDEGLKDIKGIILPRITEGNTHVYHQYTIRITEDYGKSREELMTYLKENEIGCGVYYPKPLHLHEHFRKMGYKEGDFPVSEKLAKEVLSLPVNPFVTEADVEKIVGKIVEFQKK